MPSALLLAADAAGDVAARTALERRFALAGVAVIAVEPGPAGWGHRPLLAALRAAGADAATSWLACRDPAAIPAAATAGLAGVVLVSVDPPPGDHPLVVARAEGLADAPRVMVPRGGGCWHDHRGGG